MKGGIDRKFIQMEDAHNLVRVGIVEGLLYKHATESLFLP